jgi:Protein of unknown function (DUF433)
MTWNERVTFDPTVMGGKPCIHGMRVTVGMIVGWVAAGQTEPEILKAYPYLERLTFVLPSPMRPEGPRSGMSLLRTHDATSARHARIGAGTGRPRMHTLLGRWRSSLDRCTTKNEHRRGRQCAPLRY